MEVKAVMYRGMTAVCIVFINNLIFASFMLKYQQKKMNSENKKNDPLRFNMWKIKEKHLSHVLNKTVCILKYLRHHKSKRRIASYKV